MAPRHALKREPSAPPRPVLRDRLERIFRAARQIAAGRPEKGRDDQLIGADEDGEAPAERSFAGTDERPRNRPRRGSAKTARSDRTSSSNGHESAVPRATITMSRPPAASASAAARTASRSRRRMRFRTTALPSLRVTVKPMPTRSGDSGRATACTMKLGVCKRRPLAAARNSDRRLSPTKSGRLAWPCALRPTTACGRGLDAGRERAGRPWSPSERGSRDDACARADSAGRSASREITSIVRAGRSPRAYRQAAPACQTRT